MAGSSPGRVAGGCVGIVLVGFVAVIFMLSTCHGSRPEDPAAANAAAIQIYNEDFAAFLIDKTEDGVKARLRDPDSAHFTDVRVVTVKGARFVCGMVNSRNGFGGMAGAQRFVGAGDAVFLEEDGATAVNQVWAQAGC